ncbi:amino acid adenylation domain-containing protein, partial [Aquimarina muelleri]|uniref:non-ribosomal peptide synthetase n=4 Tax=Aquimarina muelleri TaxID=279356 RepID=UPI0022492B8C
MDILSFFHKLDKEGIKLVLKNGSLNIKSNFEIDPEILSEIKYNKTRIVEHLKNYQDEDTTDDILEKIISYDKEQLVQIPLSFSQERLWFVDQLQGSLEYHIPVVIRLEGALDVSVLEKSLQRIVSRHEVLRTNLLSKDGVGYQKIIAAKNWSLDQIEVVDEDSIDYNLERYLITPFDLSSDYKLRSCLYNLGNDKYILTCVFHHIASDEWSGGILVREFTELYSALHSGRVPALPELSLQYSDYAIWQRKYLEGEVLESQLSYWENKLAGVSSLLLPTDYVRPSVQSSEGSSISFSLGQELSDSLQSLCQREGVTLFMVLISAFKVLLFRYSGQDDICVGTSIANRTQSELEGMIGFFVNMLALRSDLSGNPSFKELLGEVKNTTLEGYDHQLAPFEKVVDRVITARDISMSPLFQVLFVLHNLEKESGESIIELDGVTLSAYESDNVISKFDIELHASESDSGIALNLEYCTALFNKATIDRMLEHYQKLLCSIVSDVKQPIGSLSMLTVKEEDELLNTFNNTFLEYPKDKTVVDLFKEQVGKTPEAIALVCELKKMTYKELDDKSNQLAHYLESQGVVRGSRVGVLFEKSLDIIISILGILKLGCTYVPLDPSLPSNRLSYILDDSSINFLLYSKESLLSSLSVSEFIFFINIEESYTYESSSVSYEITPNDLAYIMYTSGSTGVPKGVMVEHGNIVSLCTSCDYIPLNRDTVWLSTGSISFDATTLEFWGTLLHGGQLVLEDTNSLLDVITLKRLIINHKVTTMWMTASWFHQVVEEDLSVFEPLCHLLVGGDVVLFNYTNKLKERYPELCLINGYGPTENTTFSTVYNIGKEANKNLPIGTPIKNSQVYITDSEMNLLPIGVVGELSVGGSGLSRGYLNESDLTREKFVSNPFIQGERMYKTGDLARWLPDGNLEFMGRIDDQVKIRGYRIELGEIESVLSSLDVVIQCCVLVKEDSLGEKCLVGYVVVEGDLDKEKIQNELKLGLSDYMVPRIWVELDAMPLTSNGKLDRKSLPEPNSLDFSTKEYVAPRNELEIKLAETWQELLGVEQIGIYDNFFELGGHSLLATRLVSMIRKELSIEIEIADIFEYSTISSLGSHVSVQSEGVFLPAIVIEDRPIRIPLSFSQERLWFLDQLEGTSSYHIPIVIQLEGILAVSVLEKSLQSIVSRHEVLRTNILSAEGVGYQEVVKSEDWFLDHKYVSDQEGLDSILNTYLAEPFDLSKDYKLRACLYDLGNDNYVLACVFHHIASDGWSGDILIKEFTELYSAFQSGRAPVLPDLSLQYSDYAIWQRKYLEGEVLENQLSYWEDKLEGVSTLSLPTDYDRPVVQSSAGGSVSLELDKELSDSLDILCREEGVTLFMVLLSGFKVLLSRYSGQEDICVGTSIANRTQSDLEGMIGFFVNTLALRSELRGDLSFRELLGQVKTTTLGGYDHQLVPFEKVVDRVITTRDMSRSPLFQVLFSLQNWEDNGDQAIDLEGLELSLYESELNTKAQFDLLMSAKREASHISFHLVYRTSLYKKSSIINMLSHYKELLRDIVCNPGSRLGDLTLLRTI